MDTSKVHGLPSFQVHDRNRYKVYGTACAIHDRMGIAAVPNTFCSHVVTCNNYSVSLNYQNTMQGRLLLPATHGMHYVTWRSLAVRTAYRPISKL
jgi:hypothetical protein